MPTVREAMLGGPEAGIDGSAGNFKTVSSQGEGGPGSSGACGEVGAAQTFRHGPRFLPRLRIRF